MPCAGCAKRRAKMMAAYAAVKQGIVSAKKTYAAQAVNMEKLESRPDDEMQGIIDIRKKQA